MRLERIVLYYWLSTLTVIRVDTLEIKVM